MHNQGGQRNNPDDSQGNKHYCRKCAALHKRQHQAAECQQEQH